MLLHWVQYKSQRVKRIGNKMFGLFQHDITDSSDEHICHFDDVNPSDFEVLDSSSKWMAVCTGQCFIACTWQWRYRSTHQDPQNRRKGAQAHGKADEEEHMRMLHVYTPSRTLCSTFDTSMLNIQQYKCKTHGLRTFSCFGPHIWNSLPQHLRHCSTLWSFKAKLKTFLFSQYFRPN